MIGIVSMSEYPYERPVVQEILSGLDLENTEIQRRWSKGKRMVRSCCFLPHIGLQSFVTSPVLCIKVTGNVRNFTHIKASLFQIVKLMFHTCSFNVY
jgi:hypothetical protein